MYVAQIEEDRLSEVTQSGRYLDATKDVLYETAVDFCDDWTERSVAVLHYSPIEGTIEGEPEAIYQYLGSQRLCDPIDRFDHVKAVVHGHAHHGTYEGRTPRGTPVFNVAQFVVKAKFGRPYALLEI